MQRKWQVLLVVSIAVFMTSLDLFIVNVAFPDIRREFSGASLGGLSWVLSAYAIVFAALMIPAGRWADAYGRKRVFSIGLALFVVASALCAAAPSVETLVVARVVQAAGGALLMPSSLGLLLPEFPPQQRALAIAIWAAVGGVAAAAGPPVGGLLVQADWRWVFIVNVPVGLAVLVFGLRLLREHREVAPLRPDVLGAAALAVGVGALVGAIVQGPDWGWGDPRVLGALGLSVAALAAVVVRSRRHPVPVIEPAMVRLRSFSVAGGACVVYYAGFGAMLFGSVLALTGPWGEDALSAGLMIAPGPATAALTMVPGSRLAARLGFARAGLLGGLVTGLGGAWWIAFLGPVPDYASDFLPGMVIGGAGVGLSLPLFTAAATSELSPARFSTGAAVVTMARQLGLALGVAAVVALVGAGTAIGDYDGAWWFMVSTAVGAGVLLLGLGRPATAPAPMPEAVTA
jgi:EmrB/QacA subfamily drug resistance transporter